jgi:hypothetical protein
MDALSHVIGIRPGGQVRGSIAQPKTKAELREMLAEAVRNTQPKPMRPPKAKRDRG